MFFYFHAARKWNCCHVKYEPTWSVCRWPSIALTAAKQIDHYIITQQMDNVAFSCLLAMTNFAVRFVSMDVSQWIVGEMYFDTYPL